MKYMLLLLCVQLTMASGVRADEASLPATSSSKSVSNVTQMHPPIEPLNAVRQNALYTNTPVDANATCGNCHDTTYIQQHNSHRRKDVNATCIDCHVKNTELWSQENLDIYGRLDPSESGIHRADNEVCGKCHGVIDSFSLAIPDDFETRVYLPNGQYTYDLTRFTGVFFSGQLFSKSQLNLTKKRNLTYPADVHAQRMVRCVDCHHSANNPAKSNLKTNQQRHLKRDPRTQSLSSYLNQPDHRLTAPHCTDCHQPTEAHEFLPYKERHLEVLDCQTCHVAKVYGPMISSIDATVRTATGAPMIEYAPPIVSGNLNVELNPGVSPALIPYETPDGKVKIGAFNLVSAWYWEDFTTGKRIPESIVTDFFIESNGAFTAKAIAAFDKNKDGKITRNELIIETSSQQAAIREWLKQHGFSNAQIVGSVDAHMISHGITEKSGVVRECESCHGKQGRLAANIDIPSRIPVGGSISRGKRMSQLREGELQTEGSIRWIRKVRTDGYYVFGLNRAGWSDLFGLLLFAGVLLGILTHGGYRFYSRRNRTPLHSSTKRVYMYSLYERIWHWLMASSVIVLLITGLKIHFSMHLSFISFPTAVTLHNVTAVILVLNAGLSLFFHLASAAILQFIPEKKGLLQALIAQVEYYTRGIFLGQKHPTEKTPDKKLNPLQQLTYLGLLNVLFPLQVLTGVAIWLNSRWPELLDVVGGLTVVGPIHNLGSWLFLTFLVVHLYLTTTGHTVFSNLSAMIDGYDDIDVDVAQGGNS